MKEGKGQWSIMKEVVINELQSAFHKCPQCFFSEHDIHSVLYGLVNEELSKKLGNELPSTSDGYNVSLVHHEYPTPFRCDMHGNSFQPKGEEDRMVGGGKYKRGHYDLVVLNPGFVKANELDVVCGKDYQKFRAMLAKGGVQPLIWACEVLYFPSVRKLPKNAIRAIRQDALKVKATISYKVNKNVNFCKMGSVHVFTSHKEEESSSLKKEIEELTKEHKIDITFTTA